MATAKQVARDLLETLPEDCTLEDISYHLYVSGPAAAIGRASIPSLSRKGGVPRGHRSADQAPLRAPGAEPASLHRRDECPGHRRRVRHLSVPQPRGRLRASPRARRRRLVPPPGVPVAARPRHGPALLRVQLPPHPPLHAPVLTTVLYLFPERTGTQDAFRLYIGDRLAYEWRFDVVRLSEIPVDLAFESGEPGPLALVPLLQGGDAAREGTQRCGSSTRYPGRSPRTRCPSSSTSRASAMIERRSERARKGSHHAVVLVADGPGRGRGKGRAEGEAKGEAEGKGRGRGQAAADLPRPGAGLHPRVAKRVLPAIQACAQPATLRAWILQCPKLSDAAFAALVTGEPTRPHAVADQPAVSRVPPSRARAQTAVDGGTLATADSSGDGPTAPSE